MRKLYIENFGPVKQADLELRDVNLFIGEQSVGKSTIAKLITILTDYISLCGLIEGEHEQWEKQLQMYSLDGYAEDNYKVSYEMEEGGIRLRLQIQTAAFACNMTKNHKRVIKKENIIRELVMLKPLFHSDVIVEELKRLSSKNDENARMKAMMEFMNNSLYIPAERIVYSVITNLMPAFALAKSSVPQNLLRFLVDLNNAKATYPEYDIPLLGISYKQNNSDDYIVLKGKQKELPLNSASSGIQSTLPLLLVLQLAVNNREYSSFVIEEPECNLFPEKQVELLKYILQTVKSNNRTLTITTHSPYLLSAMNNYLFAGTLVEKYKDNIKDSVEQVLPAAYHLKPGECSVYSLGEAINGDGIYCKNLIDEQTGMIDYNSLDTISATLSEEFEALENTYIQMIHK